MPIIRSCGGEAPGRPAGLGPMAGDSASMPTQQSLWCDEPASSLRSGQGRCDGTQQGPVLVGERWAVVLPAQDCELVAEHDDLEILRASRAHSQARQRHEQSVQNATHRTPGCERIMPGQRARPHFWAPTGPHAGGVVRDPCEVHGPGRDVDEEQQVEPAQRDGVDGGEVAGDGGLGPQELRPSDFRACGCRVDSGVVEDLPRPWTQRGGGRALSVRRGCGGSPKSDSQLRGAV